MRIAPTALLLIAIAGHLAAAPPERPNFIVILADDIGPEDIAAGADVPTPNLARLAARGVRFRSCWATPLCIPSRAQLLTGRYGFRTGIVHNNDGLRPGLLAGEVTFAELLRRHGYATAMAGKWSLNRHLDRTVLDGHGFDDYLLWAQFRVNVPASQPAWDQLLEGGRDRRVADKLRRFWRPVLLDRNGLRTTGADDYAPRMYADWMIDWIAGHKDRPFVLYYGAALAHIPYHEPPAPCAGRGPPTAAAGLCYLDHNVGRLLDALDRLDLDRRTWVVFTSDNGSASADGRDKGVLSADGVTVPLIVAGPGIASPGTESDALVDLSDVLPTLADLAGVGLPEDLKLDGVSFGPALRGQTAGRPWIFSQLGDETMIGDGRHLLIGDRILRHGRRTWRPAREDDAESQAAGAALRAIRAELVGSEAGSNP